MEQPERGDTFVRLSEDARRSVVYLGHKRHGTVNEIDPVGTGFLVNMGSPGGTYLVTAGHVAMKLENGAFDIRMNERYELRHGESKPQGRIDHIENADWFFHPTDETVDVAVMRYLPPDWADALWWPYHLFLSEFKLGTKNTGPGDLAYVVGILHFMKGTFRNMPAVHTGHIVLMPEDERIPINNWRSPRRKKELMMLDAYLVQANALPGSSGSPVFIRRSLDTTLTLPELQDPDPLRVSIPGSLWLLGLWRGAWFGKASDGLHIPKELRDNKVPVGIGSVVPAIKISEVLNHPQLQQMRPRELLKELESDSDERPVTDGTTQGAQKEPVASGDFNSRGDIPTTKIQAPAQPRKQRLHKRIKGR